MSRRNPGLYIPAPAFPLLARKIRTDKEARAYLRQLVSSGHGYLLEEDAADLINVETREPAFSGMNARMANERRDEVYAHLSEDPSAFLFRLMYPKDARGGKRRRNPDDDVLFPYADRFSSETYPDLVTPNYSLMHVAASSTARAPSKVDGNLVFDAFFDDGSDIFGDFLTNPSKRGGRLVKGIVVSEMAEGYHVAVGLRSIGDAKYVEDDLQQAFPEGNWMREDNAVLTAFGVSVGKAKALAKQVAEMLGFPVGQVRVLSVRTKMRRNPAKKPAAKSSSKRKSPAGRRASAASRATSKAAHLGKATAEVMHEDGAYEILTARGNKFSWEEMQRVVGGNIERVPLKGGRIMVVNEEGMMRGMDINPGASLMVGTTIFGPAVVLARSAME